eukprot:jgi/Galph1/910/GphlegSOOS_G5641.1
MQELRLEALVWKEHVEYVTSFLRIHCQEGDDFGSFVDWEQVYSIPNSTMQQGYICVRKELLTQGTWKVLYRGRKDPQAPASIEKRSYLSTCFLDEPRDWLQTLGCSFQFEYIRRGSAGYWTNLGLYFESFHICKVMEEVSLDNIDWYSLKPISSERVLLIYSLVEDGKDWSKSAHDLQNVLYQIAPFVSTS